MTQYCCTLLWHAEHGIVPIYITCTNIIWHSTALRYLYIHYTTQCCSALLLHELLHSMAQYCTVLLLHAQYGTVLLSVTRKCTRNALCYLHTPLTIVKFRVIVKALHIAFQFCEVHQNKWWSCQQANICKIWVVTGVLLNIRVF